MRKRFYHKYRTPIRRWRSIPRGDRLEDSQVDGKEWGVTKAIQRIHHLQHSIAIHHCNLWEFHTTQLSSYKLLLEWLPADYGLHTLQSATLVPSLYSVMMPQGTTTIISNSIRVTSPGLIPSIPVTSNGVSIHALPTFIVPLGTVLPHPFYITPLTEAFNL